MAIRRLHRRFLFALRPPSGFGLRGFGLRLRFWLAAAAMAGALSAGPEPARVIAGYAPVPPLSYRDENGRPAGFAVDVLNEAARREGIRLEWKRIAGSPRMEAELSRGTTDLLAAGMITPERRKTFFVTAPWWFTELTVATRAGSGIRRAGELAGRRLALASPRLDWLAAKHFPRATIVLPADLPDRGTGAAWRALCDGEADAALLTHPEVHEWMLVRPDQCRNVPLYAFETEAAVELAVIARPGMENVAKRLRRRIDELTADGTLVEIASHNPPISTQSAMRLMDDLRARYDRKTATVWLGSLAALLLIAGGFMVRQTRTRRALADSERRHRSFFESAAVGTAQVDTGTHRFTDVNQEFCRITGYTREELLGGMTVLDVTHPDDHAEDVALLERLKRGEFTSFSREKRYLRKDGTCVWTRVDVAGVLGGNGELLNAVKIVQDITERKEATEALRRKAQIVELSHDAIIVTGPDRVIADWNAGAEELYGIPRNEAIGRVTHELLATVSTPSAREIDAIIVARGRWEGELLHRRSDGTTIAVDSRHVLIRNDAGAPAGFLEINRDVTERKQAEAALRASEERFAAFMDHSPTIAWIKDEDGRHVYLSKSYENRFGVRLEDWAGKTDLDVWPREVAERLRKTDQEVLTTGGTLSVAEETVNGSLHHWLNVRFPFSDAAGKRYVGGIGLDVTEQRRLEERLRQSQKLESIGTLAAGAAHTYNNLLTVIMGHASMALSDCPSCENVQSIAAAAKRAADLTQQLLAYSGQGQFVLKKLPVSKMVGDLAALLRPLVPTNIDFDLSLPPEPYAVTADPAQIQQIVLNLASNAVEAIGEGKAGEVRLATGVRHFDAALETPLGFRIEPGAYATITVSDTGCGMDRETMGRIFDPFFTTKFKGRGLGLAAVSGVVRALKGAILVDSRLGSGSSFTVLLPAQREEIPPQAGPVVDPDKVLWTFPSRASAKPVARGAATVLVVDDEDTVREFIGAALRKAGYEVLSAADGTEGIAVVMREHVDLAIVDVVMPGMLGGAVVAEMRRIRPEMKLLVTSGYSEEAAHRASIETAQLAFIQKPYRAADLIAKVKAVMGRGA